MHACKASKIYIIGLTKIYDIEHRIEIAQVQLI
jgi:hypothetical protein